MGNMEQVLQGFHSLPKKDNHTNGLEIKMWNLNGTITTPWFGEDFVKEYYKEDREFHFVLELPEDIQERVGSGSLTIEMEFSAKIESSWEERVSYIESNDYKFIIFKGMKYASHPNRKNWTDAEAECQRDGGHLASVSSEEIAEELKNAFSLPSWIGGRRVLSKWSWSDKTTWKFTNWAQGHPYQRDDWCTVVAGRFHNGKWEDYDCSIKEPFICQVEPLALKTTGKNTLVYRKDQLTFSKFHVWYKYIAGSEYMLDSWEDKKMTGLRFSWRIEDPSLIWTSNFSKVGRSLKTPQLGEVVKPGDASRDLIYKVMLSIPEYLEKDIGNNALVVQIDVDMREGGNFVWNTKYMAFGKGYYEKKNWAEAEAHCRSEGGQLASIHSEEQQALAEKAAEGNHFIWLGGRRDGSQGWRWSDNSTWDFTNWASGGEFNDGDFCLGMLRGAGWIGWYSDCSQRQAFLCQPDIEVTKVGGSTTLAMKKSSLKFFPLYVTLKSAASSQRLTNSLNKEQMVMPGFVIDWYIEDTNGKRLTERLPARQEDWKQEVPTPRYAESLLLSKAVQLARQFRIQNISKNMILDRAVSIKLENINAFGISGICTQEEVISNDLDDIFSKLGLNENMNNTSERHPSDGDMRTGSELFHAIVYCPAIPIKLFRFIDHLITNESSRTLIKTIVNLGQQGAIADPISGILVKQFVTEMDNSLALQYGNVLLATSNNPSLESLAMNELLLIGNSSQDVSKQLGLR